MKLKTLIESKIALENLIKGSLPINIAWDLKKFIKVINPELSSYEELRTQKIIELGEEFEEDKVKKYKVKDENSNLFATLMNELLEKEITVVIPQIKIKELLEYKDANGKHIEITTSDLMILDWLIID